MITRRGALGLSAAAGAYWALSPIDNKVPASTPDNYWVPQAHHKAFLEAVSRDHRFVCMGDTNHKMKVIHQFVLDAQNVAAYAKAGKKFIFLEAPEEINPKLASDYHPIKFNMSCPTQMTSSYVCSSSEKESYCLTIGQSIRANPAITFKAIDQRQKQNSASLVFKGLSAKQAATLAPIFATLMVQATVFSCIDFESPALKALDGLIKPDMGKAIIGKLSDDSPTFNAINQHDASGIILFGAGHFFEANGNLRSHLKASGQSFAVINVFRDIDQWHDFKRVSKKLQETGAIGQDNPDIEIFLIPPPDCPSGIRIINKAFEKYRPLITARATSNNLAL